MGNFSKTSRLMQLVVCVMLVALAPLAQATILNGGASGVSPDIFGFGPSGPVLATSSGTVSAITFSTKFTATVVADPANTFCAGCLDYTYTYTNNGPDVNGRYSAGFFTGFMTDVGFVSGTGIVPNTVDRSSNGGVVGFNYLGSNQVDAGQTTVTLVIETNTRQFVPGFLSVQDGTAASAAAFQPTFIPEPSSLALLGGGLLVIGSFVRRFRLR